MTTETVVTSWLARGMADRCEQLAAEAVESQLGASHARQFLTAVAAAAEPEVLAILLRTLACFAELADPFGPNRKRFSRPAYLRRKRPHSRRAKPSRQQLLFPKRGY